MKSESVIRDSCKNCTARCKSAFKESTDTDLSEIEKIRSFIKFDANTLLPFEFENEMGFYCIQSGYVKLTSEEGVIRICGPGDLVGFGMGEVDSEEIVALEEGAACFFTNQLFFQLQMKSPSVSSGIINMLSYIVNLNNQRIIDLEFFSVKNRVASILLSLSRKFGVLTLLGKKIDIKLDRPTLARLSATGLESLSRILTEFENDQLIIRDGRKIIISDEESLSKVSRS